LATEKNGLVISICFVLAIEKKMDLRFAFVLSWHRKKMDLRFPFVLSWRPKKWTCDFLCFVLVTEKNGLAISFVLSWSPKKKWTCDFLCFVLATENFGSSFSPLSSQPQKRGFSFFLVPKPEKNFTLSLSLFGIQGENKISHRNTFSRHETNQTSNPTKIFHSKCVFVTSMPNGGTQKFCLKAFLLLAAARKNLLLELACHFSRPNK